VDSAAPARQHVSMEGEWVTTLWGTAILVVQIAGVLHALHAIMYARTPQSAIGWGLALVLLPYLAIPMYWVFGESRFAGYTLAGSGGCAELDRATKALKASVAPYREDFSDKHTDTARIAEHLGGFGPLRGNAVHLLADGHAAFDAIFDAIDRAEKFVIVQFYIIHNDNLGGRLREALLRAAGRGVRCRVLYDSVGSKGLGEAWTRPLRAAGVDVQAFVTNRQVGRRFQINFRNHRKLVAVDGRIALVGGFNVGDEYLGLGPLGPWRDTHVRVEGPAATAMLAPFLEDWNYVTKEVPALPVQLTEAGARRVLPFASGPAQTWHAAPGVYLEAIHDVRERLWIASPYFVPDPATRSALGHAALRGVDVRILLPARPDHLLPFLSSFTFYPAMREAGVRIWRYQPGFLHQKVLLADSDLAIVGSINLDYRSFTINFEAAIAVEDRNFAAEVADMLEKDFAQAKEEDLWKFENSGFWFRLKCRMASLVSPEQ
jgi:cardiolipin synthase A/B